MCWMNLILSHAPSFERTGDITSWTRDSERIGDLTILRLDSPRSRHSAEDGSASTLLGRWSQETLAGEWEVRQGREVSPYRMFSFVHLPLWAAVAHSHRETVRGSVEHTPQVYPHPKGEGAAYLTTNSVSPSVVSQWQVRLWCPGSQTFHETITCGSQGGSGGCWPIVGQRSVTAERAWGNWADCRNRDRCLEAGWEYEGRHKQGRCYISYLAIYALPW